MLPAITRTEGGHRRYELTTVLIHVGLEVGTKEKLQHNIYKQLPVVTYTQASNAKHTQDSET